MAGSGVVKVVNSGDWVVARDDWSFGGSVGRSMSWEDAKEAVRRNGLAVEVWIGGNVQVSVPINADTVCRMLEGDGWVNDDSMGIVLAAYVGVFHGQLESSAETIPRMSVIPSPSLINAALLLEHGVDVMEGRRSPEEVKKAFHRGMRRRMMFQGRVWVMPLASDGHWRILVGEHAFSPGCPRLHVLDSLGAGSARLVVEWVRRAWRGVYLSLVGSVPDEVEVTARSLPLQRDQSECGVLVVCAALFMASRAEEGRELGVEGSGDVGWWFRAGWADEVRREYGTRLAALLGMGLWSGGHKELGSEFIWWSRAFRYGEEALGNAQGANRSASEGARVADVRGGAEEEDLFGADVSEFFVRRSGVGQHGAYALEGDIVGADDDEDGDEGEGEDEGDEDFAHGEQGQRRRVTREVSRWRDPPPRAEEGVREAWVHDGQDEFVDDVKERALGLRAREGVATLKPGGSAQTPGAVATVWGEGESWYTLWQAEEKRTRPRVPTVEAAVAFMESLAASPRSYMVADKSREALDARDGHMATSQLKKARVALQVVIRCACDVRGADHEGRMLTQSSRVRALAMRVAKKAKGAKRGASEADVGRLRPMAEEVMEERSEDAIFFATMDGVGSSQSIWQALPVVAAHALQAASRRLGMRPDELKSLCMDMICQRRMSMAPSRKVALQGFLRVLVVEEDPRGKSAIQDHYAKARGALRHRRKSGCPVFALALLLWLEYDHPDAPFRLASFLQPGWREQPVFRGLGGKGARREMSRGATEGRVEHLLRMADYASPHTEHQRSEAIRRARIHGVDHYVCAIANGYNDVGGSTMVLHYERQPQVSYMRVQAGFTELEPDPYFVPRHYEDEDDDLGRRRAALVGRLLPDLCARRQELLGDIRRKGLQRRDSEYPYDADAFSFCAVHLLGETLVDDLAELFTEEPELKDLWVFRRVAVLHGEEFEDFRRKQAEFASAWERGELPEYRVWSGYVQGTHDAMASQARTAMAERDRLAEKVARVEAERDAERARREAAEERARRMEMELALRSGGGDAGQGGSGEVDERREGQATEQPGSALVAGHGAPSVVGVDPDSKLNGRATLEATKEGGDGPFAQLVSDYLWGYVRGKGGVHLQVGARLARGDRINRTSQEENWLRAMRQATRASFVVGLVERRPRRRLVTPVDPVEELEKRVGQGFDGRWGDVEDGKTVIAYGARALDAEWRERHPRGHAPAASVCVRAMEKMARDALQGSGDGSVEDMAANWRHWFASCFRWAPKSGG